MQELPTDYLIHLLPRLHSLEGEPLRAAVEHFQDPAHPVFATGPRYTESLYAMWCAEERMPVAYRRLYYRELHGPTARFDASNGYCLGADAYEWTLIHPKAVERARAYVRTCILARLAEFYDAGEDHEMLDYLRDEANIEAAESGADREGDFDLELHEEQYFEALFAPLREGYKP